MTTPPPGFAASGHSDGSDPEQLEDLSHEIDVDSSQDLTVEASEESTLEVPAEESPRAEAVELPVEASETPPPLSALIPSRLSSSILSSTPPPQRAPTLLGLPLPSFPLPGVTAVAQLIGQPADDEVTVMAARPSIADDEEEETKVEAATTALHAAKSRNEDDDEVTTALSAQASVEREKALRKSVPPSLDLPLPSPSARSDPDSFANLAGLGDEFEDPEDDDGDGDLAHDTPAIAADEEAMATSSYSAEPDEPSSELEAVLAPRRPPGSPPMGSPIGALGLHGRGDGFGAARLPTPSLGYGLSLPSPAPAPANSPFSARLAPVGSPYAARTSAPMPAIQIPAPSGAAALPSSSFGLFYKVQVPVVGLVALLVAVGGGGVLVGAKLWRSRVTPFVTPGAAPASLASAPAPVVIQPVPPAAAAAPTAPLPSVAAVPVAAPSATAPPPIPPPPTAAPVVEQVPAPISPPPRPVKHTVARSSARKAPVADEEETAPSVPARPRPAKASKPKVAKGWVDPFAE